MNFIEVVDLVPYFIEPHELYQNLLILLDGVQVGLRIVLDLVLLLGDRFLDLIVLLL